MIFPEIFYQTDFVIAAQSTRHGPYKGGLYPSFNLGESVGDDIDIVDQNKRYFCNQLGFEYDHLAKSKQVHGAEVLKIVSPGRYEGYDAMITNVSGILLAVTVADCVPILLVEPKTGTIAAIHSGWRGSALNILGKTVLALKNFYGAAPSNVLAYIGTCISGDCYEVSLDVAKKFNPSFYKQSIEEDKYFLDLKNVCYNQLIELGVLPTNIEVSSFCTVANNDLFYSHRHEKGNTGRMLAAIGLK